jgi:sentrin-specific protease 1
MRRYSPVAKSLRKLRNEADILRSKTQEIAKYFATSREAEWRRAYLSEAIEQSWKLDVAVGHPEAPGHQRIIPEYTAAAGIGVVSGMFPSGSDAHRRFSSHSRAYRGGQLLRTRIDDSVRKQEEEQIRKLKLRESRLQSDKNRVAKRKADWRRSRSTPYARRVKDPNWLDGPMTERRLAWLSDTPQRDLLEKLDKLSPPQKFMKKVHGGLFGLGKEQAPNYQVPNEDLSELPDAAPRKGVRWHESKIHGGVVEVTQPFYHDYPMPANLRSRTALGPSAFAPHLLPARRSSASNPHLAAVPAMHARGEKPDGRHVPSPIRHPRENEVEETLLSVFGEEAAAETPLKADELRDRSPVKGGARMGDANDADLEHAILAFESWAFTHKRTKQVRQEDEDEELEASSQSLIDAENAEKAEEERRKKVEEQTRRAEEAKRKADEVKKHVRIKEAESHHRVINDSRKAPEVVDLLEDSEPEEVAVVKPKAQPVGVIELIDSDEEEEETGIEEDVDELALEDESYEETEEDEDEDDDEISLSDSSVVSDGLDTGSKFIPRLAPSRTSAIHKAVAKGSDRGLQLTTFPGASITGHDLSTLISDRYAGGSGAGTNGWLNDEIVNGYYKFLVDRANDKVGYDKSSGGPPPFFAFGSAMYGKMVNDGVQSVSRWTRRPKLDNKRVMDAEMLFFPVNSGIHWTLLTISPKARTIEYLDSMGGVNRKAFAIARQWLKMEAKELYKEEEWKEVFGRSPMQTNSMDCGVFTCLNGMAVLRGFNPAKTYGSVDISRGRMQIAAILLGGGFSEEFDWGIEK